MAKESAIMAIAKVMIAAAWADGEIAHEEVNSLKDLLFRLPDISGNDWARLEMYMESPVGDTERARLIEELRETLSSSQEKEIALSALEDLMQADGEVTSEEQEIAAQIKSEIEQTSTGIMAPFSSLMRGSLNRRSQAVANAPNREAQYEDYINKVYYSVSRRSESQGVEIDIPDAKLRKLSLAGGLMARVAYVDREVTPSESEVMVAALEAGWHLDNVEAELVAQVAVSEISKGLDYYRLSRQFFENTSEEERVDFLDVLFTVADGDGGVSYEEIEEVRTISNMLKLTHRQFIDAKLKVPSERRGGL